MLHLEGSTYSVPSQPAESDRGLFGGNSNWRGPIWFPVNYLIVESLQQFQHYYSDDFRIECPTHSGQMVSLGDPADEISHRMINIFLRDTNGRRPVFGGNETFQNDPHWRDYIPFHEYFHGHNDPRVGGSHQTRSNGLLAKLIQ